MSNILDVPVSQGYVSTGDKATAADSLQRGELAAMSGAFYRKNDPTQAWKILGRSTFGDAGSGRVDGIAVCQFDDGGVDKLIAAVGTSWMAATPGATGTFVSLVTGLSADATTLSAAHQDDRWYLCNGYDSNRALEPDGDVRLMGMQAPSGAPTVALVGGGTLTTTARPTYTQVGLGNSGAFANTFKNPTLAMDSDATTACSLLVPFFNFNSNDRVYSQYWGAWESDISVGRVLKIKWSVDYVPEAAMSIHLSQDNGSTYGTILNPEWNAYGSTGLSYLDYPISDSVNSNLIVVEVRFFGGEFGGSTIKVFDIKTEFGSSASASAPNGVYYATTEWYAPDQLESPPSELSAQTFPALNSSAIITRPAILNPSATHWKVYRIPDGAAATPDNLGLVSGGSTDNTSSGLIDIAATTWTDKFEIDLTEQSLPIIPLVTVGDLSFFRDSPPPGFVSMVSWRGSICGISKTEPRSWFYSEAGMPESFPQIYKVTSFPLDENDDIVGQMAVGETFVFLCSGAVLAIDDIPRVTDGQYNNVDARPLKGHPGCVGLYSYTTYSVLGEPRGAWVSPFGVYVTNGTTCECISTDLAWETEVNVPYLGTSVLRWDAKNLILWFEFDLDGDGSNDREMPFHMAETHQKQTGKPKIGQPTAKATSCMASALVDSSYFRYSGHPSTGDVYVEESGTVDAATSEEVQMVVKTGQVSRDMVDLAVIKVTVNHSDFGSGQTGTLTGTFYRDTANTQNSREQSVRLDGHRGTTVGMARAGQLVDFELEYSGSGSGGIGGFTLEIDGQGRSGSAPRAISNSVTP